MDKKEQDVFYEAELLSEIRETLDRMKQERDEKKRKARNRLKRIRREIRATGRQAGAVRS